MENEKIIEKIKKVLELSKNNPSAEEAKSAALKAQKLMADYHISISDIESIENVENISESYIHVGTGNKWKYALAEIVAKNFMCKHFFMGRDTAAFYGYETDAVIAARTYEMLFRTGIKASTNYYNKLRNDAISCGMSFDGRGIKNSFLAGYLEGIREGLEKQCTALMIVVPREVEDQYEKRSENFHTSNSSFRFGGTHKQKAHEAGVRTGKDTINSRQIEAV